MKFRRNGLAQAMNKRHARSKPHKDKRLKRANNPKRSWKEETR